MNRSELDPDKRIPYTDKQIEEVLQKGRTNLHLGVPFGNNFAFLASGYARAFEKDALDQCYELGGQGVPKTIEEYERYFSSLKEIDLYNGHGISLVDFFWLIGREAAEVFLRENHDLLLVIATLDRKLVDPSIGSERKHNWLMFNNYLETLAIALMRIGLNPLR